MLGIRFARTLMWYVTREFIVSFAVTISAMTILMLLLTSYKMAAELDNFGISVTQVLMLSPFILPRALTQALPPATMIATIMVFGRLSAESEILAAQAGGAALRRFVWPLLFCSLLISALSLWLHDTGMRWGNDTIRTQVLKLNKPDSFIKTLDKPGSSMSIHSDQSSYTRINMLPAETDASGKMTRPIQIVSFLNNKITDTVFASDHTFMSADEIKGNPDMSLFIHLTDVRSYGAQLNSATDIVNGIKLPDIGALIPIGNTRGEKSWRENLEEAHKLAKDEHRRWHFMLRRVSDFGALAAAGSPLDPAATPEIVNAWNDSKVHMEAIIFQGGSQDFMRQDMIEFHRKISLGILPFSMIFLGVGLGLLVKKSNRMIGFLLGLVLYLILYYTMTIVAKTLSSTGNWDKMARFCPPQYLPNILFLILGYSLWRLFERGILTSLPPGLYRVLSALFTPFLFIWKLLWAFGRGVVWVFDKLIHLPIRIFRRTTDIYIGSQFLIPFLIIIICIGALITAIDVIDHLNEIVDGVRHSSEPFGNLPIRTEWEAVRDVVAFYGIQALDITLDFLPVEILIAGMLCAMVLVRNQEHLILKSSGVKLQRAVRPIIILGLLASGGVTLVREMWMPELMLQRDFLKPQVYHRFSQPSSLALYTIDENKVPMLFEMGQYNTASRTGHELRVYLLGEQKDRRIPVLTADVAVWDAERNGWVLYTDPVVQELKKMEQTAFGAKPKDKDKDKDPKKTKPAAEKSKDLQLGGLRSEADGNVDVAAAGERNIASLPNIAVRKTRVDFWQGPINPKYIDSDRLGAKVMRMNDLKRLSELKPELKVEWFKRISEFAMGFLLLWCALPLMFNDSTHSATAALGVSIIMAAIYWAMCVTSVKLGIDARLFTIAQYSFRIPPWAPVVPHAMFFVIGVIQFYWRMET